jgi:uncharacterized protein YbdZ (MbtH family)
MTDSQQMPEERYHVVANGEDQYSIWPECRELPLGWRAVGKTGGKSECLAHIEQVWTDMRPRSLRGQMERAAVEPPPAPPPVEARESLLDKLGKGRHPVVVAGPAGQDAGRFREAVGSGHLRVRFTETAGGTELALRFDPAAVDLSGGDLEAGTGRLGLSSALKLDGADVKCAVDIDIAERKGVGRLEIIRAA